MKTDAVDAATLAQLLRLQLIPEAHMISDAHREIRDVLRARLLLVTRTLQAAKGPTTSVGDFEIGTVMSATDTPSRRSGARCEGRFYFNDLPRLATQSGGDAPAVSEDVRSSPVATSSMRRSSNSVKLRSSMRLKGED